MSIRAIALKVNGRDVSAEVEPRTHLADFLREDLLLTATHIGCEHGVCGACTVLKDGRPVRGCLTLAISCDSADIHTLEGLQDDALMVRLRAAFKEHHGLQCGFCTPGMLATAYDIVRRLPDADEARIRQEISGNLCRCTGYQGAVHAIKHVLSDGPPAATVQPVARSRPSVTAGPGQLETAASEGKAAAVELSVPEEVNDGIRLTRTLTLDARPDQVWPVLQDIPTVVDCIPGAHLSEPVAGDTARGVMVVAIGPIQAKFDGIAKFQFQQDTRTGSLIGRGQDRLSRSTLDGALDFKIGEGEQGTTSLDAEITYRLQGPLAQFGRPAIVEEIADRLLEDVTTRIAAKASGKSISDPRPSALGGMSLMFAVVSRMFRRLLRRIVPK